MLLLLPPCPALRPGCCPIDSCYCLHPLVLQEFLQQQQQVSGAPVSPTGGPHGASSEGDPLDGGSPLTTGSPKSGPFGTMDAAALQEMDEKRRRKYVRSGMYRKDSNGKFLHGQPAKKKGSQDDSPGDNPIGVAPIGVAPAPPSAEEPGEAAGGGSPAVPGIVSPLGSLEAQQQLVLQQLYRQNPQALAGLGIPPPLSLHPQQVRNLQQLHQIQAMQQQISQQQPLQSSPILLSMMQAQQQLAQQQLQQQAQQSPQQIVQPATTLPGQLQPNTLSTTAAMASPLSLNPQQQLLLAGAQPALLQPLGLFPTLSQQLQQSQLLQAQQQQQQQQQQQLSQALQQQQVPQPQQPQSSAQSHPQQSPQPHPAPPLQQGEVLSQPQPQKPPTQQPQPLQQPSVHPSQLLPSTPSPLLSQQQQQRSQPQEPDAGAAREVLDGARSSDSSANANAGKPSATSTSAELETSAALAQPVGQPTANAMLGSGLPQPQGAPMPGPLNLQLRLPQIPMHTQAMNSQV